VLVPNLPLWFVPVAPVDETKLAELRALAAGKPVPVTVARAARTSGRTRPLLTPVAAFPPNTPLTFETGGLLDILGRPLVIERPKTA
jgi:hypothetical protein